MSSRAPRVPPFRVPLRAVVVDDELEYGQVIADILSPNYEVVVTASAEIGHSHVRTRPCHAVVIERGLGEASEVLTLIRQLRELQPDIVILVTSRMPLLVREIVECFEAGADDYLPKPFHPRELLARVDRLVRRVAYVESRQLDAG